MSSPMKKISSLANDTKVDYCTKVLYGHSVFYMILYALLESDRASQRTMQDIFNSLKFKFLFNLNQNTSIRHSSISERLSVMDVTFFEKAFDYFYDRLSGLYTNEELLEKKLVRVDSTMVAEVSNKLSKGLCVGRKKSGIKQAKFTIGFDGSIPCESELYLEPSYLNECLTIPEVISKQAKKQKAGIYVFDPGVNSRHVFEDLQNHEIEFVTRLNPGAVYDCVEIKEEEGRMLGNLKLIKDEIVYLYVYFNNRKTKKRTENTYRLITTENPKGEPLLFLSNVLKEDALVITGYYRKRWDVEVFFRFIKQELSFSHFMSTSENGIKIILYMTLILSMLLLIYKRLNKLGFKTAKRRFTIELDELIIAMIVRFCGGDPALVFR